MTKTITPEERETVLETIRILTGTLPLLKADEQNAWIGERLRAKLTQGIERDKKSLQKWQNLTLGELFLLPESTEK